MLGNLTMAMAMAMGWHRSTPTSLSTGLERSMVTNLPTVLPSPIMARSMTISQRSTATNLSMGLVQSTAITAISLLLPFDPLNRVTDQFRRVLQIELFLDLLAVIFDRLHAEMKFLGDLACAAPLADE